MDESARRETYEEIATQLAGVLNGCPDAVAAMASAAALLKERFARIYWVGFYLPDADGGLRVGPYQGPIACLILPAGRGVCGAALASGETQIVDDVHAIATAKGRKLDVLSNLTDVINAGVGRSVNFHHVY